MRFANVLHLYRVRLRARALQECFALIGIAAGVGLLFASQIASSSLSSSVGQLNSGIVGTAKLQVTARGAQGLPEKLVSEARHLPGVRVAAPLLEVSANAVGPKGSEAVELVGADSTLAELKGALVSKVALTPFAGVEAVVLPLPVANAVGAKKFGDIVKFQTLGHTSEAALYSKLSEKQIGALISSPIAISTLEYVQKASGLDGRVSRILVEPKPGQTAAVRAGLERITGGNYGVESASYDEQLFAKAAAATNQSTQLFAVISALVGFLFAFNAMLLTVPQRRRLIADLRRDGYTPKSGDRSAHVRCDRARHDRMRNRARTGQRALDPPVPLQPRLPLLGVRRRLRAGGELAEHRHLRRRRHGRSKRGCAEPIQGHRLAQPTRRDRNQGGWRWEHVTAGDAGRPRVPGGNARDPACGASGGHRGNGHADRGPVGFACATAHLDACTRAPDSTNDRQRSAAYRRYGATRRTLARDRDCRDGCDRCVRQRLDPGRPQ